MAQFANQKTLRRVITAKKNLIDGWNEGRHLETESAHTLQELVQRVAADRFALAKSILRDAERLAANTPPLYRAAVSLPTVLWLRNGHRPQDYPLGP